MKSDHAKLVSRATLTISLLLAAAALLVLAGCAGSREDTATSSQGGGDATSQTVAATEAFLDTLNDAQREQVTYDFDSDEKSGWSNFPVPVVPRPGLPFSDMTEEQQQAVMAILQAALSEEGYEKTIGIMVGDQVQRDHAGKPDIYGDIGPPTYTGQISTT